MDGDWLGVHHDDDGSDPLPKAIGHARFQAVGDRTAQQAPFLQAELEG